MRHARMQVAAAGVAVVAAGVCCWVRVERERAWLEQMLATDCRPVLGVADLALLSWGSAALVLLAGVLLVRVGVRGVRAGRRAWVWAAALGCVALLAGLVLVLAALAVPIDPLQGVDGSGLPCGGG